VNPDELTADSPSDRVRALLAFEASRAYSYYDRAVGLVPLVDAVGRPVLRTIVGIYRSLLDEIVRRDYNVLKERVSISGWKKSAIAVRALSGRLVGEPRTGARGSREAGA
jgi:phytoene synthase